MLKHKKILILALFAVSFSGSLLFFASRPLPIQPDLGAARSRISNQAAFTQNCQINGALPDKTCTPGSTNSDITQKTLSATLCNPNWSTKSIRPPTSYTTPLKKRQMVAYGDSDAPQNYELDHLISLELGGNPTDSKNLWPEPYNIPNGAHQKDSVENYLHKQICAGKLTLSAAQQGIATDWTQYVKFVSKSNNFGATISDPDDEE